MRAKNVEARFQALDAFLIEHQGLWRPRPFTQLQLPWETEHPELSRWLRQRSLAEAEASHNQPHDLPAPAPFPQLAARALRLGAVDKLPTHTLEPARHRLNVDVPGRKWQQIEAFGAALTFAQTPVHWLDWCAGKGHLGRRLLQPGQQLTCLEHDPALIASGQALSDRHDLHATHHLQDVMADVAIQPEHTPVALHACGDLHVRLLQLASAAGCKQMALAPCCYNRITADRYQALSAAGRASLLQLSIDDLGLPLSETVTAGNRVRQQRDTSMARRLGFDQLQRQVRGCDDYLPTPSLPASWLDKSFADYCQELASLKGLSTGVQDWQALEAHGWQRLAEVRNLELVRGLFRRPLELWLVLDRALFMVEQGYNVEVGSFCEPSLTPRNLMVLAERE
ncbi:MAG: SAM-dependent methyltransferase [Pseudomonadales bacterium RIFCSPLOWO2_12_60_38]|uniref:methyltransferase n=1 Tax=Pseudomonas TaxID=286 RepID=UPI0003DB8AA2|nr:MULTISPECIES: methyltransferase [unclassified Pseudomonas]ETK43263.1 SAM-dependent methyltransferase [Pseudomonas fluorescens FH5]OHC34032.1 MAG: SAM-dependent methyltransferase [Pseudomonadales bacterium RIFCSPLOWO2_12_60_38]OHC36746.1 MAG: SAM-dependent methyltransferase [Pseudomonadales bacterium RIFCSPLOWO2_12_FULL_59_450]PTT14612.1 methyltransferase [Pseudomonas sp. HMWF034]PVV63227.1 methyltransferase [Pseudomonas sp. HMWF011]